MKRIRIDFAPPGLRRALYRAPPGLFFMIPALIVLCGPALLSAQRYLDEKEELQVLQAALAARRAPPPAAVAAPAPKAVLTAPQASAVNAAISQLNLPWRDLAAALLEATPDEVALLALEPDAKRRTVRISAEARNSDDMLAYVARLQAGEWFSSVTLARHEVMQQDPNKPLRFQINASWEAN